MEINCFLVSATAVDISLSYGHVSMFMNGKEYLFQRTVTRTEFIFTSMIGDCCGPPLVAEMYF